MRSLLPSARVPTMLLLPLLMFSLAGCLSTQTTPRAETSIVADVCRAWVLDTYSSRDTERSIAEARAHNAARAAFGCPG